MPPNVEQQVVTPAFTRNASTSEGCSAMQTSAVFDALGVSTLSEGMCRKADKDED
ncbi:unnamed protein product [Dovyalis caffra]|uniref:Uncharacterized protein n=1 Tax=Dovyalis caffra TaxID=77055 RepID=A0AAV1RHX5_9ROSI|nr:unnamed protein product [Dovyalis caffra]